MQRLLGVIEETGRDSDEPKLLAVQVLHGVLEVADTAVEEVGGAAGGARGEIPALHERHLLSAERGVQSNHGARGAPADDDHIEGAGLEGLLQLGVKEDIVVGNEDMASLEGILENW